MDWGRYNFVIYNDIRIRLHFQFFSWISFSRFQSIGLILFWASEIGFIWLVDSMLTTKPQVPFTKSTQWRGRWWSCGIYESHAPKVCWFLHSTLKKSIFLEFEVTRWGAPLSKCAFLIIIFNFIIVQCLNCFRIYSLKLWKLTKTK